MQLFFRETVRDLPIGCIGCSLGALELLEPKNDEKGPNFLESMKKLLISLGPKTS
jgi:hypothetical protein